jgi:hypothetical protein
VERSDTHQLHSRGEMMGIAALHPSYDSSSPSLQAKRGDS